MWAVTVPPVVFQCRLQKLEFLQWHPSVGRIQLSFSSGIPLWGCFNKVFPVVFQCTLQVFAGWSSSIPVYTGSTSGIPVYTGPASVHWLRVRVTQQWVAMLPVKLRGWGFTTGIQHMSNSLLIAFYPASSAHRHVLMCAS